MEDESATKPRGTPLPGEEWGPDLGREIRSTHEDLSPASWRFLAYVQEHPEATLAVDYRQSVSLPDFVRAYAYALQPWPTFADARKLRQIERATVELTELVKSIPERLFGGNAGRIGDFYELGSERLVTLLLAPPNAIDTSLARCDFVDDGADYRCLELNFGPNIGGWQERFFEQAVRSRPSTAAFLSSEELRARHRDPWRAMLTMVAVEGCRRGHDAAGCFNVAVVVDPGQAGSAAMVRAMDDLFQEVLRDSGTGRQGKAFLCTYFDDFTARGGALFHQGLRISAVIEASGLPTPRDVLFCLKAGRLGLFNGPVSRILGDKRNLALLSLHEESDLFTAAERHLIERHVPWSRVVADELATYQGERVRLLDLAAARRESLVLKPVGGAQGRGVHLGKRETPEAWRRLLDEAAGTGKMLLQEYVASRPYLYQHGDSGCAPHQVVWGTFSCGGTYGGGFLRMLPLASGPGVINSARGATEGLIFEV
ncbi:MAG TPA: hypothetical protein VJA16_09815 [Thermoanaerobaculia bacterium]